MAWWMYPAAGAGLKMLQHMMTKGERERIQKLAEARAKWSPFTGDQGGLNQLAQSRPDAIQQGLTGALGGYALGQQAEAQEGLGEMRGLQKQLLQKQIAGLEKGQAAPNIPGVGPQPSPDMTGAPREQALAAQIQALINQSRGM